MAEVRLGSLGPVSYSLRDLTGADEAAVDPGDAERAALRLLGCLVVLPEGVTLDDLPVALVHRLHLALYRALHDGPVQNTATCAECSEGFEFDLDLAAICAAQDAAAEAVAPPEDGWWTLPTGGELRAPLLRDVTGRRLDDLLARITRGDVTEEAASAFLEQAAPLLDFDVETGCPQCTASQRMRFSMPRYLVRKIAGERAFLRREVHLIASAYRWSHGEIMTLTRRDRRDYAAMIEAERHQRRGIRAVS